MRTHDMYGHKITPVGSGYGISVEVGVDQEGKAHALAWLFHDSDDFQQTLLAVREEGLVNVFPDRVAEVQRKVDLLASLRWDACRTELKRRITMGQSSGGGRISLRERLRLWLFRKACYWLHAHSGQRWAPYISPGPVRCTTCGAEKEE